MKKNLKSLFLILAVAVPFLFTSCEETVALDLKVDATEVLLEVGDFATIRIIEGNEGYEVVSNKEDIATVAIATKKATEFTITAVAAGITVVKLEDAKGKFETITVNVVDFSEAATSITVEAGKTYAYKHEETIGAFRINTAKNGEVSLAIGGKTITLSDAGESYLNTTFEAVGRVVAEAAPKSVLFCLLANSTNVASGTLANAVISAGAEPTYFVEIK